VRVVPATADPAVELAPLRRSAGPWLHLLDAAPADARQLGWMLRQGGVEVRILRGHCGRSTYGFLDEVGAALQLPGDPADDWAALTALLTDLSWLPAAAHLLMVTRAQLLLAAEPAAELRALVHTVREVARGRAEEGDPVPFHLVLQDDGVGLAVLRERLDAVGARYVYLAGWDAEEPSAPADLTGRSSYVPGDREPDSVDQAVAAAVSEVDGIPELLRAWEEFRGPAAAAVRVYAPAVVPEQGTEAAAVVSRAVAGAGASCLVVPLDGDEADPRQRALAHAGVRIWPRSERAAQQEPGVRPEPAPAPVVSVRSTPGQEAITPQDPPGTPFELVTANLRWTFDPGPTEADSVDRALLEHTASSGRISALFRTWVRDPARGWVRVVVAHLGPRASIADVEGERSALLEVLRAAGAARCCVEVLCARDAGDVHHWLEERSRALWPGTGRSSDHPGAREAFVPGPAADDPEQGPAVAALVAWAADQTPVTALVTAWSGDPRTLVVGLGLDAGADPDALGAEAAALAPAARIEPFSPAGGLDAEQLRLVRASTRVWTRRPDRAQPARQARASTETTALPRPSEMTDLGPTPARDTDEPRGDVDLDGGFTLVGIDRGVDIAKGAAEPDERDIAVVGWAREQPYARALLRGVATVDGEELPVYCLAVADSVDPEAVRRALAAAVAATGTARAAAEAFAPVGAIPAFHLDLAVRSTRLWSAG
jgi:hypothetical protein